jgi:hypothetical protein
MPNTSYVTTTPINNAAKRRIAYNTLAVLCDHIFNYGIDMVSIAFDGGTQLITIVFTNPIPNQAQVDRYNIALV